MPALASFQPQQVEAFTLSVRQHSDGWEEIYVATAAIGCPAAQRRKNVYHRPMDGLTPALTAFILAGGRSTRMGIDKAFVLLDGCTLLARALELARCLTSDVRIVGDPAKFASFAPVVEDQFPGCGPLAGIHAALRSSQTDLNFIFAVDMPFLTPALLQYMFGRAKDCDGALVTVPRTAQGWQPLCAVYRREFASIAEKALRAGRYKIDALFAEAGVQVIDESELQSAGFSLDLFSNLNTPDDLAEATRKPR